MGQEKDEIASGEMCSLEEGQKLRAVLPLGPEMTAWRRGESALRTARSRPKERSFPVSSAGFGVSAAKTRSEQPPGASVDGWDEPGAHSMKKGKRPEASSARLSVCHSSSRPSGRLREPGVGPWNAICAARSFSPKACRFPGCAAQPTKRGR